MTASRLSSEVAPLVMVPKVVGGATEYARYYVEADEKHGLNMGQGRVEVDEGSEEDHDIQHDGPDVRDRHIITTTLERRNRCVIARSYGKKSWSCLVLARSGNWSVGKMAGPTRTQFFAAMMTKGEGNLVLVMPSSRASEPVKRPLVK